MDLWWSCMSVSQWTSFDGVVTFGLADHALEKNGVVMVKWVQRTVLLQSCCDLTPRKSLKQFKITICQYQCYSISSHCAPFTGEQWLQPDLLEGFSDKKDWIDLSHLNSASAGRLQLKEIWPFVQMSAHGFACSPSACVGFLSVLWFPPTAQTCMFNNWLFWVTLRMQVWMAVFPSVSVALQTGDLSRVYPISHPLSSWACSNPSSQMSG